MQAKFPHLWSQQDAQWVQEQEKRKVPVEQLAPGVVLI
jgi:hypothetical protein